MNSEVSKSKIRSVFLRKRLELSEGKHENLCFDIANQCLKLPIWDFEYFHLFLSIKSKAEVDTSLILTMLQGRDKQVIIPKVNGDNLEHILLTDSTKIKVNSWGIPEPDKGILIDPRDLDVVFMPLLGYDKIGNRVGYGKGFYDNFLVNCKPEVIKIGLSFFNPVDKISGVHTNDIPLDFCVNPKEIINFS